MMHLQSVIQGVRWQVVAWGCLGLLLGGCDRTPDRPKAPAPKPVAKLEAPPIAPEPVVPAPPGRRFDTTTVGEFFGSRTLLRPYRREAQEFYAGRGGRLGWFRGNGSPVAQAYQLVQRARLATADGLDPGRYRLAALERQLKSLAPDSIAAATDSLLVIRKQRALDLQLTGAYLLLIGDNALGAVDAGVNGAQHWQERRQYAGLARSLSGALAGRGIASRTGGFADQHPEYVRLRRALTAYRALAAKGGWPLVPTLPKNALALRPGDRDSVRIPVLRRRLAAEEALARAIRDAAPPPAAPSPVAAVPVKLVVALPSDSGGAAPLVGPPAPVVKKAFDPAVYDSALLVRVMAFQARRGLKADGHIGPGTVAALRAPLYNDIRRIRLNMERWRWMPAKKRGRYLLVNIPEFGLHVVGANGRDELTMRVIVGNRQTNTPIFADDLRFIVLAPYWNVPTSIVVHELRWPQVRNKYYLKGEDMEVLEGDNVVSADKVDWLHLTDSTLAPYRVRQTPGGANPLGPIKFIFPNDNDVYLHGTPFQKLFDRERRGFSHGCVRLEDPYKLALFLLKDQPDWTEEKMRAVVKEGEPTWITLRQRLPVYLLYLTAWADADGLMHYRDDIYGHDYTLGKALGGELWR